MDQWREHFEVMLMGAVNLTHIAVRLMTEASSEADIGPPTKCGSGGRIIHITSIHGERAECMQNSYGMVKAALNQCCRALAVELAPLGILASAVAPGFVDTPMSVVDVVDGVDELETEWFRINYAEGHHLPLRRAAEPEEIAAVAWFRAGPDASHITGQVMTVDGGLTATFWRVPCYFNMIEWEQERTPMEATHEQAQ